MIVSKKGRVKCEWKKTIVVTRGFPVRRGFYDLKVVILASKAKNVLGGVKMLKRERNRKHYSMKLVAKCKKSTQNPESLKQQFQNV